MTHRGRVLPALLPAALLLTSAPTRCRAQAAGGQKWAVVVGVNTYKENIRGLQFSVSDAEKLETVLRQAGHIPPDHVRLLVSDADSPALLPTRANILKALHEVAAKASPQDQFWFYFAGHGMDRNGSSYLLPMDFHVGDPEGTGLATRAIRDLLQRECRATQRVVVLDACHSGSSRAVEPTPSLDTLFRTPGTVTLAACDVNQVAYEFPGIGGVFTYFLSRGLAGDADTSKKGAVTAFALRDYLVSSVKRKVENEALDVQTPQFINTAPQDLALTRDSPAALNALPAPDTSPLQAKEPLGPALLVALTETRTLDNGGTAESEVAETEVTKALVADNFPLLDKTAAHQLAGMLDTHQAGVAAGKRGARFLITGQAQTSATKLAIAQGLVTVTATITARLIDEAGNVLTAVTVQSDPKPSGTEIGAATDALQEASARLVDEIRPHVQQALGAK